MVEPIHLDSNRRVFAHENDDEVLSRRERQIADCERELRYWLHVALHAHRYETGVPGEVWEWREPQSISVRDSFPDGGALHGQELDRLALAEAAHAFEKAVYWLQMLQHLHMEWACRDGAGQSWRGALVQDHLRFDEIGGVLGISADGARRRIRSRRESLSRFGEALDRADQHRTSVEYQQHDWGPTAEEDRGRPPVAGTGLLKASPSRKTKRRGT